MQSGDGKCRPITREISLLKINPSPTGKKTAPGSATVQSADTAFFFKPQSEGLRGSLWFGGFKRLIVLANQPTQVHLPLGPSDPSWVSPIPPIPSLISGIKWVQGMDLKVGWRIDIKY